MTSEASCCIINPWLNIRYQEKADERVQIPPHFIWGTATAGHQVEGGNVNSESWVLEHLPETIYKESSGDGIDQYNRYREDIAMLSGLGFNSYRLSVEWSRIEPAEGEFSTAALDHYRRVLATCHEFGLMPAVTFHHFTSPRWLMEKGGWLDKGTPDRYARYVEKTSACLGDLIGLASTFNEPNLSRLLSQMMPINIRETPFWQNASKAFGVAPEKLGLFQYVTDPAQWDVIHASHVKAREVLKSGPGDFPVGMTMVSMDYQAAPGGEDLLTSIKKDLSDVFYERLKDDDYIGVQNYSRLLIGPEGPIKPQEGTPLNQHGAEIYPASLEGAIRDAASMTGLPVYVTEHGIGIEDDRIRADFLKKAIPGIVRCLNDGIDVRGYYCWSAFDNFEWSGGYGPKFGLIEVDRNTMERRPKTSARMLGKIAKANKMIEE